MCFGPFGDSLKENWGIWYMLTRWSWQLHKKKIVITNEMILSIWDSASSGFTNTWHAACKLTTKTTVSDNGYASGICYMVVEPKQSTNQYYVHSMHHMFWLNNSIHNWVPGIWLKTHHKSAFTRDALSGKAHLLIFSLYSLLFKTNA